MAPQDPPALRVVELDEALVEEHGPSLEQTPLLPLRPLSPPHKSQQLVGSRNTRILFYYFRKVLGYSKSDALRVLFEKLSHPTPETYIREDAWFPVSEWFVIWKRAVREAGTFRVLEQAGTTCTQRQSSGDMVSSLVNLVLSGAHDFMDAAIDLVPGSVELYNSTKMMDLTRRRRKADGERKVLFFTSVYQGVNLLQDWGSSSWINGFFQGLPRGLFLPDATAKTRVRPEDPKELLEFIFGLQDELFDQEDRRQVTYSPDGELLIDGQVYGRRVWLAPHRAELTEVGEYYYYDGSYIENDEYRSGTPGLLQATLVTRTVYVGENPNKVHAKLVSAQSSYSVLEEGVVCCPQKLGNDSYIFATEVTYRPAKRRIKLLLRLVGMFMAVLGMFRYRKVLEQRNRFQAQAEESVRLAEAGRVEAQEARAEAERWKARAQQAHAEIWPTQADAELVIAGKFPTQAREGAVLLYDIPASTDKLHQEGVAPEEAARELIELIDALAEVADRHGGWEANTMGDSSLMLFGWNQEQEEDPCLQALTCAVEMQQVAHTMGQPVYIGIAYGRIMALVRQRRRKIELMSKAINEAARLYDRANPGQILVTESVRAAIEATGELMLRLPSVSFTRLGQMVLKGIGQRDVIGVEYDRENP